MTARKVCLAVAFASLILLMSGSWLGYVTGFGAVIYDLLFVEEWP